jgi:galactose-1-phosphate uridylyltransferase
MSTAPFPGVYPFAVSAAPAQHLATLGEAPGRPVQPRAKVDHARAIQKLGHAVDHLIYSRMFLTDADMVKADADAIHLLMVLRRNVFEECITVAQGNQQVKQWIMARLKRRTN